MVAYRANKSVNTMKCRCRYGLAIEEAWQCIHKPVVASLVGDVEVEDACRHLVDHDILAYPYATEKPVAVLGAKYRWARVAGLV